MNEVVPLINLKDEDLSLLKVVLVQMFLIKVLTVLLKWYYLMMKAVRKKNEKAFMKNDLVFDNKCKG